jgi:HTH-type transcriptional regulator / antitoxin HigA
MPTKYPYKPDYAVSPGVTLKETLDAKGLSQADLAIRTGLAEKTISQIINGIAPISYETAAKFELVLGTPARFWNAREHSYREALVRIEEIERLSQEVEWLKELPVNVLIEKGHINKADDKCSAVRQALRFFGVSSVSAWRDVWGRPCAQYRGATAQKKHPGHVATWLRLGELAADSVSCEPYNAQRFNEALRELRVLTAESVVAWCQEVKVKCAAAGVAVVFVKEIVGAGVSGVARWITKDKALIQLSLKYKTDDQLFFSFFHEAGHILLHGKKKVFVEDGQIQTVEEREADGFAADVLIPDDQTRALQYIKDAPAVVRFAKMLKIAPGIVVGRMQHDELMPRAYCNDLKRKIDWAS